MQTLLQMAVNYLPSLQSSLQFFNPLPSYFILNYPVASRHQLAQYLQRSGWLTLGQTGAFSEEMLVSLQSTDRALVFLRLASPGELIPVPFLNHLRDCPTLVITSPYPQHLFSHLLLHPFDFLTEPYSFKRFAQCMDRYVVTYG